MGKLKVASLFCGCGGTDVGALGGFDYLGKYYEPNNVEVVYANDLDKNACNLFSKNFGIVPDERDIRDIKSRDLPDFDILTGGFPCQSFSIIAQNPKRLGIKDDRGLLFFEMCRILKDLQPKCFVAENVKGILSANKKEAFPLILESFKNCGYDVSYKLLNSMDYGIPQKRERIFIVGYRKDLNKTFEFSGIVKQNKDSLIPLKSVIEKSIDEKYFFSERAVQGMMKNRKSMNKGRAQDINMPCNTVGSHLAKVSLNSTDPVLCENGRYRRFTPREVARIQSFPENFKLFLSESAQYRALGNAIPPVLAWYVFREIIKQLNDHLVIQFDNTNIKYMEQNDLLVNDYR
ncbi:MAG: DNA (cytosine-5-)-methyltransferase [Alkaliphilus sp.]